MTARRRPSHARPRHNPLDRFASIRMKFGTVIVFAVTCSIAVMYVTIGVTVAADASPGRGITEDVLWALHLARRLWWQLLVSGALAGILSLVLARVLARGMTRPVRDMADAARRMARGDYSVRVATTTRDEIGRLAGAFNSMAEDLAEVEQLRRDLVANVSHELKTPVAALRARLENLLDGVEDPDPATLETMLDQCDRLGAMVEQLLDLSRLESGDLLPELQPFALAEMAGGVMAEVSAAHPGSQIAMEVRVPRGHVVEADPRLFHQVLFNLVDNAARFTPDGGRISVSSAAADGHWEVAVADTGPGIPEADLVNVFERFYRVDRSRSRDDGGTGIGLAVARSIVEAHHGSIWAENDPDGGAIFRIRLPASGVRRGRP